MRPRIVIHGGVDSAGTPDALRGLERAAAVGYAALERGGEAVAAVEAAVRVLEENPVFNAGFGSVLNELGEVETDAAIVDGAMGRFAGVAALTGVMHPVSVAAELLRRAPGPVLLAGAGARRFADELGLGVEELRTSEQLMSWRRAKRGEISVSPFTGRLAEIGDTVGAIALDRAGHLAAASSTGGVQLKPAGRVGDAAVFGAGIYADRRWAALCSGLGEAAIELTLAFRAVERCRQGSDPGEAARWAVGLLNDRRAVGGIVVFEATTGRVGVAHNATSYPVVEHDPEGLRPVDPSVHRREEG